MTHIGDVLGNLGELDSGRRREGERSNPPAASSPRPPSAASDVCPICKGKGYLAYDAPPGHPDFSKLVPCRCTEARTAAERARALRDVSNLGQLSRMTFDAFMPEGVSLPLPMRVNLHEAFKHSQDFARDPQGWLVLLGGYGCGKTHLAAAIANHRVALGYPVIFVVVPDLLDHLRATYGPNSEVSYDERLEAIREAPLLILDDLGAHNSTPWAQEKLFQILNHRYNGRLATVITTNQRPEELDARIASRLRDPDLSLVWEILASDFRQAGSGAERASENLSSLALHADQTFESFMSRADRPANERENLSRALSAARTFAQEPQGWLVFTGTFGCGKTHLAAAICNYQVSAGRALSMFVVVPDLLDHLRATFSPTSTVTLDRVFEQVRSASLLVLDDLGTESATPWAKEKLFQLLNHRYVAKLPTVITTTSAINEIEPRLRSRMMDTGRCKVFAMEVASYRGGEADMEGRKPGRRGVKSYPR